MEAIGSPIAWPPPGHDPGADCGVALLPGRQRADVALGHFGLTTRPQGRGGESPLQRRNLRVAAENRRCSDATEGGAVESGSSRCDDSCRAQQSPFGRAIERFVSERLQRGERLGPEPATLRRDDSDAARNDVTSRDQP